MKKNYLTIFFFVVFAFLLLSATYFLILQNNKKNFINDSLINKSVGWQSNQSFYAGSELNFAFSKSSTISFEFDTSSKADQGVEIDIDDKTYIMQSPNLSTQRLTISIDRSEGHTVTIRHFCIRFYHPCQIKLKGIYLDRGARLDRYQLHNKVLSVLGDSISTIYGKGNYSQILADALGYELHNASILESTVSEVKDVDNAVKRYKKDLTSFKSEAVVIFLGTNDAVRNVPLDIFKRDYSRIISDVKGYNSEGKIFLVGALPREDLDYSTLQNYNAIIKNLAEKNDVNFIDTSYWLNERDFSDGVHPSFESQRKIVERFQAVLSPVLK